MARVNRLRELASCAIATVGVVFAHAITYVLIQPNAHDRNVLLTATGHGYLPAFAETALVGSGLAMMWLFLSRLSHREGELPRLSSLAVRMSGIQVGIFAAMETLERVHVHAPIGGLWSILLIGAIVQVATAILGAFLIRALLRAAATYETAAPSFSPPRLSSALIIVPPRPARPISPHLPATGLRGPPSTRSFA
jgi:hypothetical protein